MAPALHGCARPCAVFHGTARRLGLLAIGGSDQLAATAEGGEELGWDRMLLCDVPVREPAGSSRYSDAPGSRPGGLAAPPARRRDPVLLDLLGERPDRDR